MRPSITNICLNPTILTCTGTGVRINCISPGQIDVGVDLAGVRNPCNPNTKHSASKKLIKTSVRHARHDLTIPTIKSAIERGSLLAEFKSKVREVVVTEIFSLDASSNNRTGTFGTSSRSWTCSRFLGKWFQQLHYWRKSGRRWWCIVSFSPPFFFGLNLAFFFLLIELSQCDEPFDHSHLEESIIDPCKAYIRYSLIVTLNEHFQDEHRKNR